MFEQTYKSLLAQLSEMPRFLENALRGISRDILLRQPEQDRSPLLEHLWHIRDCESDLYIARIHRVLREQEPTLSPVDVGSWVEDRKYFSREGDAAIHQFTQLRASLVSELQDMGEENLARIGYRVDGTQFNILGLVEQVADHDRDHRWRIAAILRSYLVST